MIQLQSTQNIDVSNGVKMFVYGAAGVGKTMLCATAPNPVIFSAESGLLSLRKFNLPFYKITSIFDLQQAYNWCNSAAADQFETICIDSISEIAEVVLVAEQGKTKDGRKAYGEMLGEVVKLIKQFRDLPKKHVYITCKEETFVNEMGAMISRPRFPGKQLAQDVPYLFDVLAQMTTGVTAEGQKFRYINTDGDVSAIAKDRSGALAAVEEPHLGKMIDKIKNS